MPVTIYRYTVTLEKSARKGKNMGKINPRLILKNEREELLDKLYMAIAALTKFEDVKSFFRDLLTESESVMLAKRLQIAEMLLQDLSYMKIRKELGVGINNISTVNHWLSYGRDGYINALEKLHKLKMKKHINEADKYNYFSWYNLKKRYPVHFLAPELTKKLKN
ncbi:hypothetical protein C4572_01925 [Candidatus Parcubacteria bacterium]|nr:MAG: hypothetical protein C4572_01925 [Candidatus Parcubacteria bacterium]